MTFESTPNNPFVGVRIQHVDLVPIVDHGQVLGKYIDEWAARGVTPNAALQAVEIECDRPLMGASRQNLGAWIIERTTQLNTQQAQQGEL